MFWIDLCLIGFANFQNFIFLYSSWYCAEKSNSVAFYAQELFEDGVFDIFGSYIFRKFEQKKLNSVHKNRSSLSTLHLKSFEETFDDSFDFSKKLLLSKLQFT